MHNPNKLSGTALALTGIFFFSAKTILIKFAYSYGATYLDVLFLRMLVAGPFYGLILLALLKKNLAKKKLDPKYFTLKDLAFIFLLGFCGYYLASLLDFMGLSYISASLERLILFSYPTMVLILGVLIFKRKVSRIQWISMALTYAGILTVFFNELNIGHSRETATGSILVFFAALSFSVYLVFSQNIIKRLGALFTTSASMLVSVLLVILHLLIVRESSEIASSFADPSLVLIGLILGVFGTVLPSFLLGFAIRMIGSNNVGILGGIGPVSTLVLAWVFLGEVLSATQIIGATMVIAGVLILNQAKEKPNKQIKSTANLKV